MFTLKRHKARVLIVDDSPTVRRILVNELSKDPDIEIVGTAVDPYDAKDKVIELDPDVITLDIEMPRMDGITFLKLVMERRPRPVIILSTLSQPGSVRAMEAFEYGAFEVMGKPADAEALKEVGPLLRSCIKAAARKHPKGSKATPIHHKPVHNAGADMPPRLPKPEHPFSTRRLLLLGASTGGTEALKEVFIRLPEHIPPTLVVQHIPPHFSKAFAERLDSLCPFEVKEAEDGDAVLPNRALVAPGDYHMTLETQGNGYCVRLNQGPKIWHQRPAVDILFKSAARIGTTKYVGAIFTGMGKDGADGLLDLKNAGHPTYSQDEASCVVYGMPRAAWEAGASKKQVPLLDMPRVLMGEF